MVRFAVSWAFTSFGGGLSPEQLLPFSSTFTGGGARCSIDAMGFAHFRAHIIRSCSRCFLDAPGVCLTGVGAIRNPVDPPEFFGGGVVSIFADPGLFASFSVSAPCEPSGGI